MTFLYKLKNPLLIIFILFSLFSFSQKKTKKEKPKTIDSLTETPMLALYANKDSTDAFFSFADANSDGMHHFREFGNGTIGFEDIKGGGDQDFDDIMLLISGNLEITF